MDKLWAIGRVLQAGEVLKNPANWKNFQLIINSFVAILSGIVIFLPDLKITDSDISSIATGLGTLGICIFNTYFTVATTDKIGFKKKH